MPHRCLFALLVLLLSAPAVRADQTLPAGVSPTVLLVTDQSLAEAWEPFAKFKTTIGLPTKILTVQAIRKKYEGEDVQAKIRAAVLEHLDHHKTRYIILGGDSGPKGTGLVPDRDTPHFPMPGFGYKDIPTDLYYLSPGDKDWDANDDGVYGDWANDMDAVAYTHPSGASLGRIPVRTAEDVAAYTDKIIAYETRYPQGGFASRIMYTNTVDHSEPKVRKSWDTHLSPVWEDGIALRYFHTETAWDGNNKGDYSLKAGNWIERLNDKTVGKMHMHGHGMPGYWVLEDDGGHTKCDAKIVEKLTNEDAYLVMTTVSCFTGMYDSKFDPTITESMLRSPKKGAVVIVAPSREGVPIFHNPREDFPKMISEGKLDGTTESMTRFWINGLSPREDGSYRTIGEAFVEMKGQMAEHAKKTAGYHWCQSELNLLGDPTLGFRAKAVETPEIKLKSFELKGRQDGVVVLVATYEFQTSLRGNHGGRLCVSRANGGYTVVPINEDGTVRVQIDPSGDGDTTFVIAGPNLNAVVLSFDELEILEAP